MHVLFISWCPRLIPVMWSNIWFYFITATNSSLLFSSFSWTSSTQLDNILPPFSTHDYFLTWCDFLLANVNKSTSTLCPVFEPTQILRDSSTWCWSILLYLPHSSHSSCLSPIKFTFRFRSFFKPNFFIYTFSYPPHLWSLYKRKFAIITKVLSLFWATERR